MSVNFKLIKLFIAFFIFFTALSLRHYQLANHAVFDWDQDRDYQAVLNISHGDQKALGPIVKGSVGGFYLGSLYYYLLLPFFYLTHGSLISLPLTSIFLDSLMATFIWILLSQFLGFLSAGFLSLIWSFSWFTLTASQVSWNVALAPLWSLLTLFTLEKIFSTSNPKWLYLLFFLFGLSFHIHLSLIFLAFIFILFTIFKSSFSWKNYLKSLLFLVFPLLPLIYYDFTHAFYNLRLVHLFFLSRPHNSLQLTKLVFNIIQKLAKVTNGLLLANFSINFWLGISTLVLALYSFFLAKIPLFRFSGAIIWINFILLIFLKDGGFPEYYFVMSYFPIYLVYIYPVWQLRYKLNRIYSILLLSLLFSFSYFSYQAYDFNQGMFSLGAKQELVNSLLDLPQPLSIYYDFDPGRDGGFKYLIDNSQITQDKASKYQVKLTDKVHSPIYINGELCEDILTVGGMKSSFHVVQ